jgi:hypothetical protein
MAFYYPFFLKSCFYDLYLSFSYHSRHYVIFFYFNMLNYKHHKTILLPVKC